MAQLLARCPIHGVVSVPDIFGGTMVATISNVGVTCPVPGCRLMTSVLDGTYEMNDGRADPDTFFRPPGAAQAIRIKNVVEWGRHALETGANEADVRRRLDDVLEKNAPAWRKVIDVLLSQRAVNLYQLLGFILMLLVFFGVDPTSSAPAEAPGISVDEMRDLLDEYLEDEGGGTQSPQAPAPQDPPQPPGSTSEDA